VQPAVTDGQNSTGYLEELASRQDFQPFSDFGVTRCTEVAYEERKIRTMHRFPHSWFQKLKCNGLITRASDAPIE
jgi:hypothetical protein